jgi:hypothetical protein
MECTNCGQHPVDTIHHWYWHYECKQTGLLCAKCYQEKFSVAAKHYVHPYCEGEKCMCGEPATHKVKEDISWDEPFPRRYELVAYICCKHFKKLFGPAVHCEV